MSGHAKNHAALLTQGADTVNVESARNERIAKQIKRSKFMGLGENPPQLISESSH
jgi:hypothetical protein